MILPDSFRRLVPGLLALGVLAFALTGCFSAAQSGNSGGASVLVLSNQTRDSIHYVYISPCRSNSWGQDRLGSTETVRAGTRRTFAVTAGCYDLRARFGNGRTVDQRRATFRPGRDYVWTLRG